MQTIQQDYIECYLDIYFGYPNFTKAREISQQYLEYPVKSWRDLFLEIDRQLKEYDSDQIIKFEDDDDDDDDDLQNNPIEAEKRQLNKNQQAAQQEEHIEFALEGTKLIIDYQNTSNITISFYILELEILFSKSPFSLDDNNDLCYIIPNKRLDLKLNSQPEIRQTVVDIPEDISTQNLHITLRSKSQHLTTNYYSLQMKVFLQETVGILSVIHDAKPLSKVYCKVFYQDTSGTHHFFKDGYTDIRGKFEYSASSNIDIDSNVTKFAILVASEQFGSKVFVANKPGKQGYY